ncbi:L-threonylcarbamoyladenylate synthase [Frigidibacter sp. RF13]|uniref:L-threonylcarbamoyladenylate synthase n=1 Tax=Frigidibacter sp. RF13 TaxID=2997340 RepID=UPI0022719679|nr:L-threonylcarbamoyladenylate synthase [Frigidibacter sp. RF13]MCY1127716.1 L-threonylcarbamoyladenylate synthase [Frigidibacter sp. RF13]
MLLTELLPPTAEGLGHAARHLAEGRLVAFPTETVYGLGGDARDDRAVASIFAAKGRPAFNPLIVHVPDMAAAARLAVFSDPALRLAAAFWPGALTLVLPMRDDSGLSPLVSAGLPSVAIRMPAHPVAVALLHSFGGPVAAPSANPSGRISPTRAEHVLDGLAGRIAAVLDGGACPVGVESTIIGLEPRPTLLRPGGIPVEAIEECLGVRLAAPDPAPLRPNAPGQLSSHYAPSAAVMLEVTAPRPDDVWIGFGSRTGTEGLNLSPSGDLVEAAANLFHYLREADRCAGSGGRIAVAPIPEKGLGRAINDRLRRAAAPR